MTLVGISPISLSLSDNSAIETILSDIPFFCVGLLTFGVFTFALALKRVNLIVVYLYMSSFLAFIAGIFDLSHVLSRGRATLANGVGLDVDDALVTTREALLAVSLGFSYVFLWLLVAQCPPNERDLGMSRNVKLSKDPSVHIHSASWRRWGVVGLLMQWSLLGLAFSIPILQILWRVSPLNRRFGTIYVAESTIEVVASALFMLKILLNIYLSPITPWWRPIRSNIAPLLALAISTALGLGNLFALVFSETTLGRFLRAVQMYILILFMLITAFYQTPNGSSSSSNDLDKSSMRISEKDAPPITRPPVLSLTTSRRNSGIPVNGPSNRLSITTTMSRLSSRVFSGAQSRQSSAERIYVEDRELGLAPAKKPIVAPIEPPLVKLEETRKPTTTVETNLAFRREKFDEQSKDRPVTTASIPSYYGAEDRSLTDLPPPRLVAGNVTRDVASPVYGLNGIIRSNSTGLPKQSRPPTSTSFDELLRQQTELDQSIAALRLFSPEPVVEGVSEPAATLPPVVEKDATSPKTRSASMSTASYVGRRLHDSTSNRSEFSLSNFPEPPVATTEEPPFSTKLELLVGRARKLRQEPNDAKADDDQLTVKAEQDGERSSLPVSLNVYEGETSRMESAGTQYDVTSFIGGLTFPGRGSSLFSSAAAASSGPGLTNSSALPTGRTILNDLASVEERSPDIAATTPAQGIRPMILTSSSVVKASSPEPETKLDESLIRREPNYALRPLLLGTSAQEVPVRLPSSTMVPVGSRQRKGLPMSVRRPTISGPSPLPEDQAPGAYERPRPPPLLINK